MPAPAPGAAAVAAARPRDFLLNAGEEDRLIAQLAYALAADAAPPAPPTAEARDALRAQAVAALSDFAFRYLHNRAEDIRREAAAEARAAMPRPPGFGALVLANLLALAIAGGVGWVLATHPDLLAGRIGL
jgi:hypothetical protein